MKYKMHIAPTWYVKIMNSNEIDNVTKNIVAKEWTSFVNNLSNAAWKFHATSIWEIIHYDYPLNRSFNWEGTKQGHKFWAEIYQKIKIYGS